MKTIAFKVTVFLCLSILLGGFSCAKKGMLISLSENNIKCPKLTRLWPLEIKDNDEVAKLNCAGCSFSDEVHYTYQHKNQQLLNAKVLILKAGKQCDLNVAFQPLMFDGNHFKEKIKQQRANLKRLKTLLLSQVLNHQAEP